ncbi:MAG: hypothetical protein BWY31_03693 [Lentisphaerae bacterium ADurb.Bin242]|nr:MAG: hypothetical protein BWY31_03693 [Lentisphaerae bacterium ADurb.Bin242]
MATGKRIMIGGCILLAAGFWTRLESADFSKEIEAVKAGKLTEAKAAWWGFHKEDSTRAVQSALDSGAKKIVIENMGADWVTGPLVVPSDMEIVIRDGVVMRAKEGAWQEPRGKRFIQRRMFEIHQKKNVVLRGEGKVKLVFPASEQKDHRHTVSILDSDGVTVKNLEIERGGGDCVYVGSQNCRNVTLENLDCHHGWRQGLSVTGCDNLVVRNCKFNDTKGTAPQCGLDLEPNYPDGKTGLTRILFENCEFNRNELCGVYVANNSKQKIDVTFKNCSFEGNDSGAVSGHVGHKDTPRDGKPGRLVFLDCKFKGNRYGQLNLTHYLPGVAQVVENCEIDTRGGKFPALQISSSTQDNIKGLVVRNLKVIDDEKRPPIVFTSRYGNGLVNPVIENVTAKTSKGETIPFDIPAFIKKAAPDPLAQKFRVETPDFKTLLPAFPKGKKAGGQLRFREKSEYIVYANPGDVIGIRFTNKPVHRYEGRNYRDPLAVTLHSPTIDNIARLEVPFDGVLDYTLKAQEKGVYRFSMDARTQTLSVESDAPGQAIRADEKLYIFGCSGILYFAVPPGVKEVLVELNGSPREPASGWLYNAKGEVVDSGVKMDGGKILVGKRSDDSKFEVWALRVAVAKSWVRLGAPLVPLFSTAPANLLVPKEQVGKYSAEPPKLAAPPDSKDGKPRSIVTNGEFMEAVDGKKSGKVSSARFPAAWRANGAEMLTDDKGKNSILLKGVLWHYMNLPAGGATLAGEIVASGTGKLDAYFSTSIAVDGKMKGHRKRLPLLGPFELTEKPQSFRFEIKTSDGEMGYIYFSAANAKIDSVSIKVK